MRPMLLGVNIDHIATLRQARGTTYPDPVAAAGVAEQAGADLITAHLREDRRHIQDEDIRRLAECVQTRLNLEMAITPEMLAFAEAMQPADVCLVPEKRAELTTEGGLDVAGQFSLVENACTRLAAAGIRVSLFVDAEPRQIEAAQAAGAPVVELHTGHYAEAEAPATRQHEWQRIAFAARLADGLGLVVNAGHGLHYGNVQPAAAIPEIRELNIGHAIVARAVFTGLAAAVAEMKELLATGRQAGQEHGARYD